MNIIHMQSEYKKLAEKMSKLLEPINAVAKSINGAIAPLIKSFNRNYQNDALTSIKQNVDLVMRPVIEIGKTIDTVTKPLAQLINAHRNTFEKLTHIANEYKKREKHINNVLIDLENPDFKIISENIISLADVYVAIDLDSDPDKFSIFTILSSDDFHTSLLDIYSNIGLDKKRSTIISEALQLHRNAFYCGSTCLLYSLIEGVLTEYLAKSGYIIEDCGKFFYTNKNKKIKLNGLRQKLDCIKKFPALLTTDISVLEKLDSFQFICDNEESTVSKIRNLVMHGTCIDFNEKRSGQLILWLFSLLMHLKILNERDDANVQ